MQTPFDPPKKETSPWVFVGIGCAVVAVLLVIGLVAAAFIASKKIKQFEADMKDPGVRIAKAKEVLGAKQIPAGYYATLSMSIPHLMDLAILSDRDLVPGEKKQRAFDERGFIYVKVFGSEADQQSLRDYFDGKTQDDEALRRSNIHLDVHETIKRGSFEQDGHKVLYIAQRGKITFNKEPIDGITTMILIDCTSDQKRRMAFWFGPDPSPDKAVAETDFTGTPADEAAIRTFLANFEFCGR